MKLVKNIMLMSSLAVLLTACVTNNSTQATTPPKHNLTAAGYNVQLGVAYLRDGYTQRAKTKLMLALEQAPDWAPAYDAMGYYYEMTGNQQEAEKHYLKALALDPKSGATQNNYGTYLCRNKKYEEAEKHFLLAIQDPNYLSTAEAYENAGLCAMEAQNNPKAIDYFNKALQQDPRRSTSLLELAVIDYHTGKYAAAKSYLSQYMQVANPDPQAIWLGIHVAEKQKDQASLAYYQKLLQEKFPDNKLTNSEQVRTNNDA